MRKVFFIKNNPSVRAALTGKNCGSVQPFPVFPGWISQGDFPIQVNFPADFPSRMNFPVWFSHPGGFPSVIFPSRCSVGGSLAHLWRFWASGQTSARPSTAPWLPSELTGGSPTSLCCHNSHFTFHFPPPRLREPPQIYGISPGPWQQIPGTACGIQENTKRSQSPALTSPVPPCRTGCPACALLWEFGEPEGNHPASSWGFGSKPAFSRNKPIKASSDQSQALLVLFLMFSAVKRFQGHWFFFCFVFPPLFWFFFIIFWGFFIFFWPLTRFFCHYEPSSPRGNYLWKSAFPDHSQPNQCNPQQVHRGAEEIRGDNFGASLWCHLWSSSNRERRNPSSRLAVWWWSTTPQPDRGGLAEPFEKQISGGARLLRGCALCGRAGKGSRSGGACSHWMWNEVWGCSAVYKAEKEGSFQFQTAALSGEIPAQDEITLQRCQRSLLCSINKHKNQNIDLKRKAEVSGGLFSGLLAPGNVNLESKKKKKNVIKLGVESVLLNLCP